MKMVPILADYGGLGVSEWLWVWKASASPMVVRYDATESPTRLDTDRTKSDARYDQFDYEILKSQFQTINLVRHDD